MTSQVANTANPKRSQPWFWLHGITWLTLLLVAASFVVKNLVGQVVLIERQPDWSSPTFRWFYWEFVVAEYGWPMSHSTKVEPHQVHFHENKDVLVPGTAWNAKPVGLAVNVAVGLVVLACTAISVEYWCRHRRGPFQFSLRALMIATVVLAVGLALITEHRENWTYILYPPLAVGLVSVGVVLALILRRAFRRSDGYLSTLRNRFRSAGTDRAIARELASLASDDAGGTPPGPAGQDENETDNHRRDTPP